jgi:hypothetical protein
MANIIVSQLLYLDAVDPNKVCPSFLVVQNSWLFFLYLSYLYKSVPLHFWGCHQIHIFWYFFILGCDVEFIFYIVDSKFVVQALSHMLIF